MRKELDLPNDKTVIAILPGSRGSEMKYLLSPFLEAATTLSQIRSDLIFVMPCANPKRRAQVESYMQEHQLDIKLTLFDGRSRDVMLAADVVLLASGTATLEAMLLKKPMLVGYKVSAFSYWIYSKLLKIKSFSLPNLLAGKTLVKELMQDECTTENILLELELLLNQEQQNVLLDDYTKLHKGLRLGGSDKAADAIAKLIEGEKIE